MNVSCLIRYQIDPFQYFLPHEGTNDVAWALIAFDSLASYEAYRARLKADTEGRENFAAAETKRFILREERTFIEAVEGTLGVLAAPPAGISKC